MIKLRMLLTVLHIISCTNLTKYFQLMYYHLGADHIQYTYIFTRILLLNRSDTVVITPEMSTLLITSPAIGHCLFSQSIFLKILPGLPRGSFHSVSLTKSLCVMFIAI